MKIEALNQEGNIYVIINGDFFVNMDDVTSEELEELLKKRYDVLSWIDYSTLFQKSFVKPLAGMCESAGMDYEEKKSAIEEPSSPCIKMCFVLLSLMSFKNASRLAGVLKSAEKF